jgi:hypothetical protein
MRREKATTTSTSTPLEKNVTPHYFIILNIAASSSFFLYNAFTKHAIVDRQERCAQCRTNVLELVLALLLL